MKTKLFSDRRFYEKLIALTLPIAFQSLMLASVAAADALMLGHLEQDSMAAVSLATQVQFIQNMILSSVGGGVTILGAQYWGKGDKRTVQDLFNAGLRLNGIISVIFFIACVFFPRYLMLLYASDPVLIRIGCDYLRIAGFSYLLTGISQTYLGVFRITEQAKRSALISSVAVVLNIVLNAVFIFGLFGLPSLGARGAAAATLISRVVELIWALVSSREKGFLRPDFARFFHRDKLLMKDFRRCFLPILGASLLWGVGFTSYTAIMGHLGSDAAAANSISAVVRDLVCCMCNGIASAGGILIGNELGAGDLVRGRAYGDRLMKLSVLIGILSAVIVLAVTPFVMSLMEMTDEAMRLLRGMLLIMAVYIIARCMCTVIINGIFAAGGDTLFDMYSLAVAMWGIAVPLSMLGAFVFHWPVLVVYACTCLDEVGKIPWVLFHFSRYKWVKDLTRETGAEQG